MLADFKLINSAAAKELILPNLIPHQISYLLVIWYSKTQTNKIALYCHKKGPIMYYPTPLPPPPILKVI